MEPMEIDQDVITLSAAEVAALNVSARRAHGPALVQALVDSGESEEAATAAVGANLEAFIAHLQAHPAIGAVRFHVGLATLEALEIAK